MAVVAIAGVVTMLAGCAPAVAQQSFRVDDVPKGGAKLAAVRTAPAWMFWDKTEKAWVVNTDGKPQFIPLDAAPTDLLEELAGPLGGLASHMTIPITPGF